MRNAGAVVLALLAGAAAIEAQGTAPALVAPEYIDGSGGLSLEEAVRVALEREPALRAEQAQVDAALGALRQARLRPNPMLMASHQDEPAGMDAQTRVEVQWPLDEHRRGGRIAAAEREVVAARHAVNDERRTLAAAVRAKYGDVASSARDVALTDALLAATAREQALIAARVEQGAAPSLERDVVAVEVQRLRADRVLQAGRAAQALVELGRLVALRPDAPLKIRLTLEELVAMPPGAPPSASERPDVELARARVQVAEARVREAREEGRPEVSLTAMYMRMAAGFPQQGFGTTGTLQPIAGLFHYVGAGATVSLPFLNRNQGAVAAAAAARAGAEAAAEAAERDAEAQIAASRTRLDHASRAPAAYTQEITQLARQNLDVVRQTYALGRATVFDVLEEQRRYLELERAHTTALLELFQAREALRLALGGVE
jgi:cobalt-zinc-cadmium efflux system outer membrane protein